MPEKVFCKDCYCWELNNLPDDSGQCHAIPPVAAGHPNMMATFPKTTSNFYCFAGIPKTQTVTEEPTLLVEDVVLETAEVQSSEVVKETKKHSSKNKSKSGENDEK